MLVGGHDEDLVLDRPGPQQHFPVIAAGGLGEGRRDHDDLGSTVDQAAEQFGEPEVVAGGLAESPQGGLGDDDFLARLDE